MKARCDVTTAPNGAVVEVGTVELGDREFSALGAVIDEANGIIVGYPALPDNRSYVLQNWCGADIAPLRITGYARGFHRTPLTCWALDYNGRRYSGRNSGTGVVLTMRAGRFL